jgi:CheY-like chemotaxis protein
MDQPPARRCAIWVNTTTLIAAQELADFAGVDLDRFIEFVVQELHDHEEREGSFRAPAQDSGPASVIPINGPPATAARSIPLTALPLVLVIDDSDDTREMYAVMLRLEGFVVEEARDGQEGVAKAIEALPVIIITDLAMPVMDGWETIRRLRVDERTRGIPIIACTAREAPSGARDSGADVLLAKPCPLDTLLLEVRQLLRRGAAA